MLYIVEVFNTFYAGKMVISLLFRFQPKQMLPFTYRSSVSARGQSSLLQIMIMINGMVTVQIHITMVGGIINGHAYTQILYPSPHISTIGNFLTTEMKIRPKDCITQ